MSPAAHAVTRPTDRPTVVVAMYVNEFQLSTQLAHCTGAALQAARIVVVVVVVFCRFLFDSYFLSAVAELSECDRVDSLINLISSS